ncbi:hypothetical protein D3C75_780770 [compost metagenome]
MLVFIGCISLNHREQVGLMRGMGFGFHQCAVGLNNQRLRGIPITKRHHSRMRDRVNVRHAGCVEGGKLLIERVLQSQHFIVRYAWAKQGKFATANTGKNAVGIGMLVLHDIHHIGNMLQQVIGMRAAKTLVQATEILNAQ